MASERRIGSESSETRKRLLDIAERLMLDEGYAAVTSRRVAGVAGVNPALVHYYFPVTDDLFLAVYRRGAERALERHSAATRADQPLRAMWKLSLDARGTALDEYGVDPVEMTPSEMVMQMTALSRTLVVEKSIGLTEGHEAARALIEKFLDRYEPLPERSRRSMRRRVL
jgi:AcrR family transcriptional regulator